MRIFFLLFAGKLFATFSHMYSYEVPSDLKNEKSLIWTVEDAEDFDELLLSWDGERPEFGALIFSVNVRTDEWSFWMPYCKWETKSQSTFSTSCEASFVRTFQDTVNTEKGKFGSGFQVKVDAVDGATLQDLRKLHISISDMTNYKEIRPDILLSPVRIDDISGRSQIILDHPRSLELCSPTSTSTVINYLLHKQAVSPEEFADHVHDDEFDIYGNWALNVAEANHLLKGKYVCHIERLQDLSSLHEHLVNGYPVIVSVKGKIKGAPMEYKNGHLMVVVGLDLSKGEIHLIDSAFDSDDKVAVSYQLNEFLRVWNARKNLAYIFE